jgi:drug/metabolite transporter (DMT)-like permease
MPSEPSPAAAAAPPAVGAPLLTAVLTGAVLVCFAANSLLCRLALADGSIDAVSFTAVRLTSGAVALALLSLLRGRPASTGGGWTSAAALFLYAAPFSIAYVQIGAAVGALVLFGAVQVTMIGYGILRGERPAGIVWLGLALALGGLAGLTLPGAAAARPWGLGAMVVAGLAWGAYSLLGRTSKGDPITATAGAFARAAPLSLLLLLAAWATASVHASARGLWLATASGVLASGAGYSLWYRTLPRLSATTAAIVQLLVPVVAAAGAVVLLGERPSQRLLLAGGAILGGVVLAVLGGRKR